MQYNCVLGTSFAHNICILTEVKHLKNSMIGCTPEICEFTTEYSIDIHTIYTHKIENIYQSHRSAFLDNDVSE